MTDVSSSSAKRRRRIPRPFRGLRHPYRLVVVDDAHRTELASFRLTKQSVWATGTLMVLLAMLLTTLLIVFSPLKYYIPGYGSGQVRGQVLQLQQATDSLEDQLRIQFGQLQRLQTVISGQHPVAKDTTLLSEAEIQKAQIQGPQLIPTAEAVAAAARQPKTVSKRRSK
jgi:hypothetical protein